MRDIQLEHLLTKSVIFELDQELPHSLRTFFSETVLRFVHQWRLQQGQSRELRNVLVLEEVHNVFGDPKRHENAGLETALREIRSFGQGIVAITQQPSKVPTFPFGQHQHPHLYGAPTR